VYELEFINIQLCFVDFFRNSGHGCRSVVMAAESDYYRCNLPPRLIAKAEVELREKPQWRERDIQALRDMVVAVPGKKISVRLSC
jgi:hypothetical protein